MYGPNKFMSVSVAISSNNHDCWYECTTLLYLKKNTIFRFINASVEQ